MVALVNWNGEAERAFHSLAIALCVVPVRLLRDDEHEPEEVDLMVSLPFSAGYHRRALRRALVDRSIKSLE